MDSPTVGTFILMLPLPAATGCGGAGAGPYLVQMPLVVLMQIGLVPEP